MHTNVVQHTIVLLLLLLLLVFVFRYKLLGLLMRSHCVCVCALCKHKLSSCSFMFNHALKPQQTTMMTLTARIKYEL